MSTKDHPELATPPIMAMETDAEAFILPVPATEASSKLTAFPVSSSDAISASYVKSKDDSF